ncbi:MAG: beta-ketoacyl-[Oscillospiraceae bacterium]|nr:beta-ketoacyl-[acyl-carrier-protein] synthase family protein [Oscillospiraceae bacterium]
MGAVTPVGIGVEAYWNGLISGQSGIDVITQIDTETLPVKRAAEVKQFRPKDFLSTRLTLDLDLFMQYAYVSAQEALEDSGLDPAGSRVGVVMGTALGGISLIGKTQETLAVSGKSAGPRFLVKAMGNLAAAQFAIWHGIKGPSLTVSTACSSGGDAITMASMLIRAGAADAVVVMAGEAAICPTLIQSLSKAGALSKTGESRPFDKSRNGFVIGEGGGALILETASHAEKRNAPVKAVLLGSANNTDAYNPVSPDPEGTGAAACIRLALEQAGLMPEQVDYINAHGTATQMGDIAETKAIRQVFGSHDVLVSSTKGATGHMMGAGGITEVIACIKALETGIIPPTLHLTEQDEACDLHLVTPENQAQTIKTAMSNALGFGGQNSCVIVGRSM